MSICPVCKNEFSRENKKKYCSFECAEKVWKQQKARWIKEQQELKRSYAIRVCQNCEQEYNPYYYNSDRQKFCSENCKIDWHKKLRIKENKENADLSERPCLHCGKEFQPNYNTNHARQIYCSNQCKIDYHKEQKKIETDKIRSNTVKTCPICDVEFTPKKTLKEMYCSKKCQKLMGRKIYKMMATCYQAIGTPKEDQSSKLLGYSPKQLLEHLQKHPQWDELKHGSWHLDHKFPIIAFVRKGIFDPALICCIDNLQPLSGRDNCKKNDKYNEEEFELWLKKQKIL